MSKSLLVFSYYTNMPGACQAEWIDDRLNAYIKKGYDISIVSATCCHKHINPKISHVRIPTLSPTGASYECQEIKRRNIPYARFSFLKFYLRIMDIIYSLMQKLRIGSGEGRWSWTLSASIGYLFLKRKKYEYIFTTGGPASAHLAGILIAKLKGKKVICELQDPLSGKDIGRNELSKKGLKFFERFIIKHSDSTIYCTENAMIYAKQQYPEYADKIDFVYPGANALTKVVLNENTPKKDINITYLGSLYETRNLDNMMKAIEQINDTNPAFVNSFTVNLYGNINPDIKQRILNFSHNTFKIHGLVDRDVALKRALEADVLLLVQNTDDRSITTIPFKTYDYLHTGRLILALIYRNDEIERMLRSHGHLTCQADRVNEIGEVLLKITTDINSLKNEIRISELTPERAVDNMQLIMEPIL